MDMCYNEALVMPKNYVTMDEDEMTYVSGGINLGMSRMYLNKTACIDQGRGIVRTHGWNNVTGMQLAKEIYGHAVVYYRASVLEKIGITDKLIYSHVADGVDVDNKVDRYQAVWDTIWNLV